MWTFTKCEGISNSSRLSEKQESDKFACADTFKQMAFDSMLVVGNCLNIKKM